MSSQPGISFFRECFKYDPETGSITWKHRPIEHFASKQAHATWNKRFAGKEAGGIASIYHAPEYRYRKVRFCGRDYLAHRLAWALHTGEFPEKNMQIDHIDGDPLNNRAPNLRLVIHEENARNQRLHKTNTSGVAGVSWSASAGKWHARIWEQGRHTYLGSF